MSTSDFQERLDNILGKIPEKKKPKNRKPITLTDDQRKERSANLARARAIKKQKASEIVQNPIETKTVDKPVKIKNGPSKTELMEKINKSNDIIFELQKIEEQRQKAKEDKIKLKEQKTKEDQEKQNNIKNTQRNFLDSNIQQHANKIVKNIGIRF